VRELVALKCKQCGRVAYPARARCLTCRGREFETIEAQGLAKLLTFTESANLPLGIDERRRTLGIVEFENGVRAMGVLKVAHPQLGMKLKPSWQRVRAIDGEPVFGLTLDAA